MSKSDSTASSVAVVIIGFGIIWPSYLWRGYLGAILWRWFVVAAFGVPALTTWQTAGVIAVISFLSPSVYVNRENESNARTIGLMINYAFLLPLLIFAGGVVVKLML